jgi:hypothetical protein
VRRLALDFAYLAINGPNLLLLQKTLELLPVQRMTGWREWDGRGSLYRFQALSAEAL